MKAFYGEGKEEGATVYEEDDAAWVAWCCAGGNRSFDANLRALVMIQRTTVYLPPICVRKFTCVTRANMQRKFNKTFAA